MSSIDRAWPGKIRKSKSIGWLGNRDRLLQFQGSINLQLRRLPVELALTQWSVIQFVCVMMLSYEMFHIAQYELDTLLKW